MITDFSELSGWTAELERYYAVALKYNNPADSGIQVGVQELANDYAVLDLSGIDSGRYLVPGYNEGYMLIEAR